jgi:hypothetical protein
MRTVSRKEAVRILRPRQKPPLPQDDTGCSTPRRTAEPRRLADLISIGPAMLRDFDLLGIRSVAQLARQDPRRMYARLSRATGERQDPCVLDTFCAAVAQARNPRLAAEKCQWRYWSRKRKQGGNGVRSRGKKQRI